MWDIINLLWVVAVILSLGAITATALKAYFLFDAALKESRLRFAKKVVSVAVQAAEQLAITGAMPKIGFEKKNVVRHMLEEIEELKLDPQLLDFLVEAEVYHQFNFFEEDKHVEEPPGRHIQG